MLGVGDFAILPTLDDWPFGWQPEIACVVEHQDMERVLVAMQDDGEILIERGMLWHIEIRGEFSKELSDCNRPVEGELVP